MSSNLEPTELDTLQSRPASPGRHSRSSSESHLVDYSGAEYVCSDDEDSSPLVPHPPPLQNIREGQEEEPRTPVSAVSQNDRPRPKKSLLRRLASMKRPKPETSATINPRNDRYSMLELHDVRDDVHYEPPPPDDMPNVDISFFEGFEFQSDARPQQDGEGEKGEKKRHTRTDSAETEPGPSDSHKLSLEIEPAADMIKRSKTIREQGQDLANRTNTVVGIDKRTATVDLSVLEGETADRSATAPTLRSQSYFYPVDPEQPNWKPISMRSGYIIMLAVVSFTLAGVQEYLWQRSSRLEQTGDGLITYNEVTDISTSAFFSWKYLPTLVTVLYGVLWQVADYEVQRLEPYYQLSQPTGNTAEKSLNLDYVTMWSYLVPYKAIKHRHWTVLVSVLGTILATTAAPSLQTPSIYPSKNPKCPGLASAPCDSPKFFLRVNPVWSRLVTACLGIVAILAVILLFQLRRKSGLLSDPLGVAGVAAMANRSHILAEFQGTDEALHDDIHKKLHHRRYILYKSTIWQGECTDVVESKSDKEEPKSKPPNLQPIILRPVWLVSFIVFMAICLPLVPAISYNLQLNQAAHKVPWLPVLVASLIKQLWATLQFNVKMLEPFHTLSKGNARPEKTLTLDYQGTPYGVILVKSLINHHWLVALVSFGAILSDLLTVTVSSLSLKTETPGSFYSSSALSIGIIVFMIVSAFLILFRRRQPFMPRQPSTIASVLAFIHQSQMLDDFTGTECFTNSQMQDMLMAKKKRYGLGWFRGRDGRPHCAIDQEPMLSHYVHGVSYIRATAPWEEYV